MLKTLENGEISVLWRYKKIKIQDCNHILPSVIHIILSFDWLQQCSLFQPKILNPKTNDKRSRMQKQASTPPCFPSVLSLSLPWNSSKKYLCKFKTTLSLYLQGTGWHATKYPTNYQLPLGILNLAKIRWKLIYTKDKVLSKTKRLWAAAGTQTCFKHCYATFLT